MNSYIWKQHIVLNLEFTLIYISSVYRQELVFS